MTCSFLYRGIGSISEIINIRVYDPFPTTHREDILLLPLVLGINGCSGFFGRVCWGATERVPPFTT